jgi:hypothetical protein
MLAVISIFFAVITSLVVLQNLPAQEQRMIAAVADVEATSALAYRESLITYLNQNAGFSGVVPDTSLTLLWGHVRTAHWTNIVSGGALYVYEASPTQDQTVLDTLYTKTNKSFMVGRNVSGTLMSAKGLNTSIAIPVAVPNGSIVIFGK